MEQVIVVFLLFVAVLAYGWFYWQRAKARPGPTTTVEHRETDPAPATPVDRSE